MKIRKASSGRSHAVESLERRDLMTFGLLGKNIAAVATVPFSGEIAFLGNLSTTFSPQSITINWGDGTPSAPDIDTTTGVYVPPQASNLGVGEIDATHTYASAATQTNYNVKVTVTDQSGISETATLTAIVALPTLNILPVDVSGLAGENLSASNKIVGNAPTIANFLDPDLADTATGYTSIIDWGDGTSSAGKVAGSKGVFTVSGDHKYVNVGTYPFTVTVLGYGNQVTTSGTATITTPTTTYTPPYALSPIPVVQTPGQASASINVATLTDNVPNDTPSDLTALITWGDGDSSVGQLTGQGKTYIVSGDYAYANPGTYPIAVTVTNQQTGQTVSAATSANIVNTSGGPTSPFNFTVGLASISSNGPGALANATDSNRPTLSGATQPFAIVQLTATLDGLDAPLSLGQAIASGSGQWTLPVGPLADGTYAVTATVTAPGGNPQAVTIGPGGSGDPYQFTVDTQPPALVSAVVEKNGNVRLTFEDRPSELNLASLEDAANYILAPAKSTGSTPLMVISSNPANLPMDEQSVVLIRRGNPKNRAALRQLTIKAGNIVDVAGNSLPAQANGVDVIKLSRGSKKG